MNERGIVTLSLVYVGVLVALSRSWLGDVRGYVQRATGKPAAAPTSSSPGTRLAAFAVPPPDGQITAERAVVVEFLVGYAVLWLALTALTESENTAGIAAALAATIASGATVLYLASAVENLGLAGVDSNITREA